MKTSYKVSTKDCKLCGKAHTGYNLQVDSRGTHYVICGSGKTAKRVDIKYVDPKSKNPYQPGKWEFDNRI